MSFERKLAAIMFTDIVGYTEQMSKSESKSLDILEKKRSMLKSLLKEYNGTFVKEIGDGTLSYFDNTLNCIKSAIDLLKVTSDDKSLNIRIGVHYGDIIFNKNDIYGDAVNISSRIENMSSANTILITKEFVDVTPLFEPYKYKKLGLYAMKGIGRLIDVYNVIGPKLSQMHTDNIKETDVQIYKSKKAPTIGIMPLINKGEKKDDFYAYSISSNLINNVTSLGNIKVPNIRKVEGLQGEDDFLCEHLLVQYLLSGTLWKLDDNFQISIDLYDNITKSYIWQDHWQDEWDNLSVIQSKILDGIIKTLNKSELNIYGYSRSKSEAYEYYLKGTYYYQNRQNLQDIKLAQGYFINATEIDNDLLVAKNHLGVTYIHLGKLDIASSIYEDVLNKSKEINDIKVQAMTLSNIGEMHFRQGNYKKALEYYNQSNNVRIALNDIAGQATQKHNIACIERIKGNFKSSVSSSQEVIRLCSQIDNNELHIKSYLNIGDNFKAQSKHQESLLYYKKAYDLSNSLNESELIADSLNALATTYNSMSENKKAIDAYEKANEIYKKLNNKQGIANILNNVGLIYLNDRRFDKSKEQFNKSLSIKTELKDNEGIANCLLNLGNVYLQQNQLSEAEKSFLSSLKIFKKLDDVIGISFSYYSLGELYRFKKKYVQSIENFSKAKEIDENLNDLESVKYIQKIINDLEKNLSM